MSAGLVEPITVTEVQRRMASERLIAYGQSLGIVITPEMSMLDASALICKANDDELSYRFLSLGQWSAAWSAGVVVSALMGPKCYDSAMEAADVHS